MNAKMPGSSLRIEPVKMDFHYGTSFGKATPEAYERLLLDAMSGDATLFARRDEVEEAWKFVDAIRAEIGALRQRLPSGTDLFVVSDTSIFTRNSLNGVQRSLIEAD